MFFLFKINLCTNHHLRGPAVISVERETWKLMKTQSLSLPISKFRLFDSFYIFCNFFKFFPTFLFFKFSLLQNVNFYRITLIRKYSNFETTIIYKEKSYFRFEHQTFQTLALRPCVLQTQLRKSLYDIHRYSILNIPN